jgi:hypothetical protein
MKTEKMAVIGTLSDDVLCALIARNEVRKLKHTPESSPIRFVEIFNKYSRARKGDSEKQTEELEKKRKDEIAAYVDEHLTHRVVKDGVNVPIGIRTE